MTGNVRSGSKTPSCLSPGYFRSTPNNGHHRTGPAGPVVQAPRAASSFEDFFLKARVPA